MAVEGYGQLDMASGQSARQILVHDNPRHDDERND